MDFPKVTIAVPSFNQGAFLGQTLDSIYSQRLPIEVFVMDGGSTDNTLDVIAKWEHRLAGWRSRPDEGQAAAINEGIAMGTAPLVAWLNSDDLYLEGGLIRLFETLHAYPNVPAVYGKVYNLTQETGRRRPVWVQPFSERVLTLRCPISQPATLIRRTAWEAVGGLNPSLHMAMDYDLWWRLYHYGGPLAYTPHFVAVNRDHALTKTNTQRSLHYEEAMQVVQRYHGRIPLKWRLYQPYAVALRSLFESLRRLR